MSTCSGDYDGQIRNTFDSLAKKTFYRLRDALNHPNQNYNAKPNLDYIVLNCASMISALSEASFINDPYFNSMADKYYGNIDGIIDLEATALFDGLESQRFGQGFALVNYKFVNSDQNEGHTFLLNGIEHSIPFNGCWRPFETYDLQAMSAFYKDGYLYQFHHWEHIQQPFDEPDWISYDNPYQDNIGEEFEGLHEFRAFYSGGQFDLYLTQPPTWLEEIANGQNYTITWMAPEGVINSCSLYIDLSINNQSSWSTIAGPLPYNNGTLRLDNGQYDWFVPGTISSSNCNLRLRAYDYLDNTDTLVSHQFRIGCGMYAQFQTGSPTVGDTPLTVEFQDLSPGDIINRFWDFGDGNTSTEQHPTHTYIVGGYYDVSLTVEGPCGFDTETKYNYIHSVGCDNTENWSVTHETGQDIDIAVDILRTDDGGYITLVNSFNIDVPTASDFCIYLQKINAAGCLEWDKFIEYSATNDLFARRFIQTSDGGYFIVGDKTFSITKIDVCVIKTNSSGEKTWMRTFGGINEQRGFDALETASGDFLLTGVGTEASGIEAVLVMKIDGDNGDSLQAVLYAQPGIIIREDGRRILDAHSGGYIVLSSTNDGSAFFLWLDNNLDTTKTVIYNETGKNIWTFDLDLTSDLGYICSGYSEQPNEYPTPYEYDIFMLKLDIDGNFCWTKTFGEGGLKEKAWGIHETTDGGFIIAGETDAAGQLARDIVLLKTNACGNLHWEEVLYESGDEYPCEIIQTSDSGFAICGSRTAPGETYGHSYIVKIPEQPSYICGDVDGDDAINILDIVFIINYKYKEGTAPDPVNRADVNCDGNIDILDIVYLQNYKYKGGPDPCPCN